MEVVTQECQGLAAQVLFAQAKQLEVGSGGVGSSERSDGGGRISSRGGRSSGRISNISSRVTVR